jgi:hypothetical protein
MSQVVGQEIGINSDFAGSQPETRHTPEWWEPFVGFSLLLIGLAWVGAYLLPSYPSIVPYVAAWFVLVSVILWFLFVRVQNVLKLPMYREVTYKANGTPVVKQERRFVLFMARIPVHLTLLSALQVIFATWRRDYEFVIWSIGLYLPLALLAAGVFTLLWPKRPSKIEQWLDTYLGWWATVLLSTVLIAGMALMLFNVRSILSAPSSIWSAHSASWSTLYSFAREQAVSIDKDAVLESVIGGPPYYASEPYSSQTTPFELDFTFRRPAGGSIRVDVLDVDPPRLQKVISPWSFYSHHFSTDELSDLDRKAAYIKLSPREVYSMTEVLGIEYGKEQGSAVAPHVNMFLDHDWSESFGVPAGWNMEYSATDLDKAHSLYLRVDGATGKVVNEERWPEDLESTPTPSPAILPVP